MGLFLDGSGPAKPLDYQQAGHVDPAVIATFKGRIGRIGRVEAAS
jgi:hypothetical protein